MADPPLIVDVDQVARRLGLDVPVSDPVVTGVLSEAIADTQAVAESYLGVPLGAVQYVEMGLWPLPEGWPLTNEPLIAITSTVAELNTDALPTGRFTVTYTAGLDVANNAQYWPVRRWVVAHAATTPEVRRLVRQLNVDSTRVVKSLSAEGQSVSWDVEQAKGASGGVGSGPAMVDADGLPTLASLDRWRRANRRIYQRPTYWSTFW